MDIRTKMRSLYGEDVSLKLVSPERSFFRRKSAIGVSLSGGDFGVSFAQGFAGELISALEERAIWARFGL
jgi:serine protease SohB